jgi:large subunit ribosomal protein L5
MNELKEKYTKEVIPKLKEEFKIKNSLSLPKIEKITVNVGVGKYTKDEKYISFVEEIITKITGQKPVRRVAKKSIAGFKIREGNIVGVSVCLRREKMYSFLDNMINIILPRTRDFRGISRKQIDSTGNLTVGISEVSVFPEVETLDFSNGVFGLQFTVTTSKNDREKSLRMFELLGFPFEKNINKEIKK